MTSLAGRTPHAVSSVERRVRLERCSVILDRMSTAGPRRRRRPNPDLLDGVLAVGVLVAGIGLVEGGMAAGWMPFEPNLERISIVLLAYVFLAARRLPMSTLVLVLLVTWGLAFWTALGGLTQVPQMLLAAILVSANLAGRWGNRPRLAMLLAVVAAVAPRVVGFIAFTALGHLHAYDGVIGPSGALASLPSWGGGLFDVAVVANAILATLLGVTVRRTKEESKAARAANERLLKMREHERQRAVAEERIAISRDVHDIVAHHVTAIVLRAQSAEHAAAVRPQVGIEALGDIREAGQEALASLRDVLDSLRSGERAHRPFAEELDLVVRRVAGAGIDVQIRLDAAVVVAPEAAEPLLRVVAEALTNSLRHSTARRALVRLLRDGADAVLVVDDDGVAHDTAELAGAGAGLGLQGMRERIGEIGGTLVTGWRDPQAERGWMVEARIPARVLAPSRAPLEGTVTDRADGTDRVGTAPGGAAEAGAHRAPEPDGRATARRSGRLGGEDGMRTATA